MWRLCFVAILQIIVLRFPLKYAYYLAQTRGTLNPGVVPVPKEIDMDVARRKLASMGVSIDSLTEIQADYLNSEG